MVAVPATPRHSMRAMTTRQRAAVGTAWVWAAALLAACTVPPAGPAPGETAWIRVNQVGYLPGDPKIAILSSDQRCPGTFTIGPLAFDVGPDQGAWGPFAHSYRLDFSALREPGRYVIRCGEVASLPFSIGDHVYDGVREALLGFLRLQRCGDNPVTGKRCHQQDAIDVRTGEAVDLVGGWHDAADRIKHMITTSYCVAALELAGAHDEAAYGARLLRKIQPDDDTIYVQIGDDRDHGPPPALWDGDRTDYGWGPGGPRPAWPATGAPDGPKYHNASTGVASLAGRTAAALALVGDVEAAERAYRLALAKPGCAMSVPVAAPYYYGESTWHDDVEWAATELFVATGERGCLEEAIAQARAAGASGWMGKDRHGHYQLFPYVDLAHWRLYPHVGADVQRELATFYRDGLERVAERARENPYRLGTPLVWCSNNDVIAFATQAVLYERMTGDARYRALATEARDWVFGRNPWGVSMVVGVPADGDAASQPHHLFWRLEKRLPVGGLVDGPVYPDIDAMLKFTEIGADRLARFQSKVAVYHDAFEDYATNEPILDGTVSLLLLLRVWPSRAPSSPSW